MLTDLLPCARHQTDWLTDPRPCAPQVFDLLEWVQLDAHPNAHACRLKLLLGASGSQVCVCVGGHDGVQFKLLGASGGQVGGGGGGMTWSGVGG